MTGCAGSWGTGFACMVAGSQEPLDTSACASATPTSGWWPRRTPGTGAAPRILLSIGVDDVDETLGRVEALGGSVRGAPNDMPWGLRVAHIQDPDGNPVNLTQPIPAR
ncbi:hypothetical protein GCM10010313_13910 [Streptomyces violarus]|nr:hypothetical protein GCM10010313_13910 [Streptomyces violarus]